MPLTYNSATFFKNVALLYYITVGKKGRLMQEIPLYNGKQHKKMPGILKKITPGTICQKLNIQATKTKAITDFHFRLARKKA